MNRDTLSKRGFDRAKALRKKRIANLVYGKDYYGNFHQYTKNKIHCSCGLCQLKSTVHGRGKFNGNYLCHRDKRELVTTAEELEMDYEPTPEEELAKWQVNYKLMFS